MYEILTAEEMQKADQLTIASGTPSFDLMKAAGTAVAQKIIDHTDAPCAVLILCGRGNNGGDGFVAAATLKKLGWPVRIACLVKPKDLKGDAAKAAKMWDEDILPLNSNLPTKDIGIVVDAVFGTGFQGTLEAELVTLFDKIRNKNIPVLAVDVPSGINATDGSAAEGTLQAKITVTFCRKKYAHVLLPAKTMCGRVYVAQIGISDETITNLGTQVFENDPALWLTDYPLPTADMHKYDRGHVCVIGGAKRTGAACLAASAAQKIGAGLTTIAAPEYAALAYQTYRASLMVDTWATQDDLKATLRDTRKNALVLGPGLGLNDIAFETALTALAFRKKTVLDADIFSLFADNPDSLFEHLSQQHILTPHDGEFDRIFPNVGGDKLSKVRKAAEKSGAIVLLKGSDTIICAPDSTCIINTNAPPTLATGGSGDVLSGFIAGLIAQGMPSFMAAAAGCWLQGRTAAHYGIGLTPEDLITHVNQVLGTLFAR